MNDKSTKETAPRRISDIQKIAEQLKRAGKAHVVTEAGSIVTPGMVFCSNDAGEIVAVYDRNTDELVTGGEA